MKKILIGLGITVLLTGCMSTSTPANKTDSSNLIADPQLTIFRSSKGKQGAWVKSIKTSGKVGSSGDTAFGESGSARIRFIEKDDNFREQPAISQTVRGLEKNSNYNLSMYISDKRGPTSNSKLILEIMDLNGDLIDRHSIHITDLRDAKRGEVKKHFRQTQFSFNTGNNTDVKISAKLQIIDPSKIDLNGDIGKQTEIRVDEFKLTKA